MDETLERRTLAAEDDHWWYRGRRSIVLDAVARALPGASPRPSILDAGCGGGAVLAELAGLGETVGLEPSAIAREVAAGRRAGPVVDGSLEHLPFEDSSFEVATCLDVLEHVDDDRACLRELGRVLGPTGALVVTVPAHPRLWSRHDELNHHRRRYTRAELRAAAAASGWSVARVTHFNTLLLPLAVVARRVDRGDGLELPPAVLNRALQTPLELERLAIGAGLILPVGLSILAELRR